LKEKPWAPLFLPEDAFPNSMSPLIAEVSHHFPFFPVELEIAHQNCTKIAKKQEKKKEEEGRRRRRLLFV